MFFKKKYRCPIPDWDKEWMEDAFKWMIAEFGLDKIHYAKVLLPTKEDFVVDNILTEKTTYYFLEKIASQMFIDYEKIQIFFFEEPKIIIGEDSSQPLYLIPENNPVYAGGYHGIDDHGKYVISINKAQLNYPGNIIATIAHELSHIILSDIHRIETYDEYLTDLLIVFYGIGIFGANSAFNFFKNFNTWGYSKQGYLNEKEWTYALALFASIRKESTPEWSKYLKKHITTDLTSSIKFIENTLSEKWYLI